MKVLWLCNMVLPRISSILKINTDVVGGWLSSSMDALVERGVELTVIFPYSEEIDYKGTELDFYSFKRKSIYESEIYYEKRFLDIVSNVQPDIIHIHGTEFSWSYSMMKVCNKLGIVRKSVISIQGLVSIYANHYFASLPPKTIFSSTFRELLTHNNLVKQRKKYFKRGIAEVKAISMASNVIGRTSWDKACVKQINSKITYHHCNETMRPKFYTGKWSFEQCEKFSIFVTQNYYPIKGFHFLLDAINILKEKYPTIKVYTTGYFNLNKSISNCYRDDSYSKFIRNKIYKYGLTSNVVFLGRLTEERIREFLLKVNVFVLPSAIENSPNSLGEAMLLGTPCVSAYVGGVKDLMEDGKEGLLYQYDAPYMLADAIDKIFSDDSLTNLISNNARIRAAKTHNREENCLNLMNIYKKIDLSSKINK